MHFFLRIAAIALFLAASAGFATAQSGSSAVVSSPSNSAFSHKLSHLPPAGRSGGRGKPTRILKPKPLPRHGAGAGERNFYDRALQRGLGPDVENKSKPAFAGIGASGEIPSDANIAVGKTTSGVGYIVQLVNSEAAVFNKSTGALVTGPVSLDSFWTPLGGPCAANDAGDPVVQYDRRADRWLITQLGSVSGPNYSECIAVSQTNDPSGAYYLYSYSFGTFLNDYPKFGVWPTDANSAYVATYNMFAGGSNFSGANLCVYDRAAMLSGAAAPTQICFAQAGGGYLPGDLDGATWPAAGTLPIFLSYQSSSSLTLYQIAGLDFSNPSTAALSAPVGIPVASFTEACASTGTCIPQPNSQQLDSLGDRLMYRLTYRIFSDHSSIVVNHSVVAVPGSNVGVRWYELRSSSGAPNVFSLYQQGTYAPDSDFRWMGSAAMDGAGDIAIGYSKSSGGVYPSIAIASRTSSTALGALGAETTLVSGAGAQTTYSRWGDYTALRIDPDDDATFWYTNQYYMSNPTPNYNWTTAISSFKVIGSATTDFSLGASPSSLTVARRGKVTSTVTALGGSSSVKLAISGLPRRVTANFSPNPVAAGGSSTLTIATSWLTPRGGYSLTLSGNNGTESHSIPLTLSVK